jgi:hypothetical protein
MTMSENDDDTVDNGLHHFECIGCHKTDGLILAAVWADNPGPFDLPIGYGCINCYPQNFDRWMVEFMSDNNKKDEEAA